MACLGDDSLVFTFRGKSLLLPVLPPRVPRGGYNVMPQWSFGSMLFSHPCWMLVLALSGICTSIGEWIVCNRF